MDTSKPTCQKYAPTFLLASIYYHNPNMPFIRNTSSSSSSSSSPERRNNHADGTHIVYDDEYPAVSFPDYHEKPLSQQLEPIAVVGMGCRLPGDVSSVRILGFDDREAKRTDSQSPCLPLQD